jgi:hypothetical protein
MLSPSELRVESRLFKWIADQEPDLHLKQRLVSHAFALLNLRSISRAIPPRDGTWRRNWHHGRHLISIFLTKGNHVRTLIEPQPRSRCVHCHGELRLKQFIQCVDDILDLDTEIFVCINAAINSSIPSSMTAIWRT